MLDLACVYVDLETTGGNATRDRITEIAIIEVKDGVVIDQWSSLVNPQQPIHLPIQLLTGISNEMVSQAPCFTDLQEPLYRRLKGRLFIAHNARFDYGFLKNEFRRGGIDFQASVLCTVKLSRKLYPEHPRHNLDSLIERHAIYCSARHRAMGDAQGLWQLAQKWAAEKGADPLRLIIQKLVKTQSVPLGLTDMAFEDIPTGAGVYFFYGDNDVLLYVGKSIHLRARVMSHFSGDHRLHKDMRIAQQIKRIAWTKTSGELGALLLESQMVKKLSPIHNRQLRRESKLFSWYWAYPDSNLPPELVGAAKISVDDFGHLFGLFRSKNAADDALRQIASTHQLCLKQLGLEKRTGACFGYQIKRCRGACIGLESASSHAIRFRQALTQLRTLPWPYKGRIGIREMSSDHNPSDVHFFDHWCYLGSAQNYGDLDLLSSRTLQFDVDTYKILRRFLVNPPIGTEIISCS